MAAVQRMENLILFGQLAAAGDFASARKRSTRRNGQVAFLAQCLPPECGARPAVMPHLVAQKRP